jgi:hypothetical protein
MNVGVLVCLYMYNNICLLLREKREAESGHKRGMNFPLNIFDVEL